MPASFTRRTASPTTAPALDDFLIHRGQALLDKIGDGSQVDGFLTTAKAQGWEVVPAATYLAGASGMVDHAVFETFWD